MNTYIAIIGTFLAACEIIRCVQNHINLRGQKEIFERECGQLSDITDRDLENQREVYRMLRYKLAAEEYAILQEERGNADGN